MKDVDTKKLIEGNKLETVRVSLSDGEYIGQKITTNNRTMVKVKGAVKYETVTKADQSFPDGSRLLCFAEIGLPQQDDRKTDVSVPPVYIDWANKTYFRFTVTKGWANFSDRALTKDQATAMMADEVAA